jgi:PAS domain S-box-containing protein
MKLRAHLILLVIAGVLPVVIFAAVMAYLSYRQQRDELASRMIERARAISAALDREFLVSIQSLKVLAASTHLDKGELGEFYGDMKGALAGYNRAWQNLTLVDASGQQLINLRRPFGAPLPATGNPEAIEQARRTRQAVIANVSPGPVTGAAGIVVHVPIVKDGEVKYFLNAIFYPAPLTDLLLQQKLPAAWIATIVDRKQNIAARTRDVEKFIGKPVSPTFAIQAKQSQEATWRGITLDGSAVLAAHHRSDFTGWTVGIGSPVDEVEAPLRKSLVMTGAGGLFLLLLALGFAIALGRRIAAPVAALSGAAEKLGRGEIGAVPAPRITELNRLAQGLANAAKLRIEAEEQLRYQLQLSRNITDKAADSIFVFDESGRITFINPEAERTFGFSAAELIGQPLHDKVHHHYPDGRPFPRQHCALEQVSTSENTARNKQDLFFRKDGSAVEVECSNAALEANDQRVGAVLMVRDVTERNKSALRIRQLNRVYAVLSDINQAIVRLRDRPTLLSSACRIAVEKGGFRLAWIGRVDASTGLVERAAAAGFDDGYIEQLTRSPRNTRDFDGEPSAHALRQGFHVVCNDLAHDVRQAPWQGEALQRGFHSCAAFPLKIGDDVVATFNLYSNEPGFFNAEELALLDELAADIGLALEIERQESERVRAENALRESEERFRQLAETIREVFWLSSPDKSRIIYVSPGYEMIWGRTCQSLYDSPRDWLDAIHPEDRERVLQAALSEQETGIYDQEFRIVRPDGDIRWIRDRAFPVRDGTGTVYRIAGIAEDVTVRKEAEVHVRTQNKELQLLQDVGQEINSVDSPDGELPQVLARILQKLINVGSFDLGSIRVEDVSEALPLILVHHGYRYPEQINRSTRIMNRGNLAQHPARYRVIESGKAKAVDDVQNYDGLSTLKTEGLRSVLLVPLRHDENTVGLLQLGTRSLRQLAPKEIRFYETLGNYLAVTTQRHRLWEKLTAAKASLEVEVAARTRELTAANERLTELDQVKTQFLANMSHELRTPLNAIIGFSQIMYDGKVGGPVSAEQKEYLGDILNSATHLLQLINDVLDLSKVEAGRMEVLDSTFRLDAVVVEVVQNVTPIMSVKGLKLIRDIPEGLPPITTDRRKFLQILLNLASNAVKFTEHGEIGIRCQASAGMMQLSVSDTGIGIRATELERLFQPFSQIDDSLQKRHEGTGLGLYLSSRLATLLGGNLTVASEYGKGSTFTLTLPWTKRVVVDSERLGSTE